MMGHGFHLGDVVNRRGFLTAIAGVGVALLPHAPRPTPPLSYVEWLEKTVLIDCAKINQGHYDMPTLLTPYPERYQWYLARMRTQPEMSR